MYFSLIAVLALPTTGCSSFSIKNESREEEYGLKEYQRYGAIIILHKLSSSSRTGIEAMLPNYKEVWVLGNEPVPDDLSEEMKKEIERETPHLKYEYDKYSLYFNYSDELVRIEIHK